MISGVFAMALAGGALTYCGNEKSA